MIITAFFLAFFALIMQGILVPKIDILAMSPFLALVILNKPLERTLFLSLIAGACVDLFSDDLMGIHALNYVLIAGALFQLQRHFSYDHPLHFSLFTALISFLSTLLQLLLLFLFDRRAPLVGRWMFLQLIETSIIDALYAFVWFAAPLMLMGKIRRFWVIFWLKKRRFLTLR